MSDSYFDLPSRIEDAFAEIDSDIVMDLLNTDEDYTALSERMDKLKTQYPVIDKMNEGSGEIRMTSEEHRAYADYLNLVRQISIGFGITVKQIVYCRLIDWELVLITQRIKYLIKIGFVFTDVTNITFLRVDNADL